MDEEANQTASTPELAPSGGPRPISRRRRSMARFPRSPGRIFPGRSGSNTLPPDYANAGEWNRNRATAVLLGRFVLAAHVHGQPSSRLSGYGICVEAQRGAMAFTCMTFNDAAGCECLTFEVRHNRRVRFAGHARKIDGRYRLESGSTWEPGPWQRRFFGSFPIPEERSPYRSASDADSPQ